jgi:quinoprotein glucose dehydrogenase
LGRRPSHPGVDSKTGKELWVESVHASGHAVPITYQGKDGKQQVVIAAGGGGFFGGAMNDAIVVFAPASTE